MWFETDLSVTPPYRLDLTVDVLRRLAANIVDVVDDAGTYRRALTDARGTNLLEVTQPNERTLSVRIEGAGAKRWLPTVRTMLGLDARVEAELAEWHKRVARIPWLRKLARRFEGVHPPRYPTLWEALAHAIVFQQISIAAAGAIMRRTVEALSAPVETANGKRLHPFITPAQVLYAPDDTLRTAGLSPQKIDHLRSAAAAIEDGLAAKTLERLGSAEAAERLRKVRGIGPWSAALVLLRGLGRLDVFPLKDSGVARSLVALSHDADIDAHRLLERLGPVRGMLYFHLLLGRMHKE